MKDNCQVSRQRWGDAAGRGGGRTHKPVINNTFEMLPFFCKEKLTKTCEKLTKEDKRPIFPRIIGVAKAFVLILANSPQKCS